MQRKLKHKLHYYVTSDQKHHNARTRNACYVSVGFAQLSQRNRQSVMHRIYSYLTFIMYVLMQLIALRTRQDVASPVPFGKQLAALAFHTVTSKKQEHC
jgi:hypothetical protein